MRWPWINKSPKKVLDSRSVDEPENPALNGEETDDSGRPTVRILDTDPFYGGQQQHPGSEEGYAGTQRSGQRNVCPHIEPRVAAELVRIVDQLFGVRRTEEELVTRVIAIFGYDPRPPKPPLTMRQWLYSMRDALKASGG